MRVGIEGILDEFLYDGSGTFDNFAGGDLIGDLLGEQTDAVHGGSITCEALERKAWERPFVITYNALRFTLFVP